MKKCLCLHLDHDHKQTPNGEFVGPCNVCRCQGFKALSGDDEPREAYRKSQPSDRDGLEQLLAKRMRRRFETLFDEEALGFISGALIATAWTLGWEECRESYAEEPDVKMSEAVKDAITVMKQLRDSKSVLRSELTAQIGNVIEMLESSLP